jgi:threonylcarbamoyladenosine tRNA methylthiotransferase MtaB
MTSFSIQNFGCRVNQAEAFSWAEEFEQGGLRLEEDSARADVVVVNTCTLTNRAVRDVRKFIRKIFRLNPQAKLIIAGCAVDGLRPEFEKIPQAWLFLSNEEKGNLTARVLRHVSSAGEAVSQPWRSRALLKIQDGCNLRCTFCVIPYVRGKSRSFDRDAILSRAKKFVRQGFKEIVLCGIHLSSYGHDLQPKSSLLDLLQGLVEVEGMARLRLSSLDPRFLDDELIDFISGSQKVCPHFHLSLQHGSDRILRLMGRESRISEYERILSRLRRNSPEASVGADMISGFPGESEEDFEKTFAFLENSPLTYFHVFTYSPRPGTQAEGWPQVEGRLKRERSTLLRKLSEEKRRAFRLTFLGHELDGIVIKKNGTGEEVLTSNYIDVHVSFGAINPGEAVKVKITRVESKQTWGKIAG